MILRSSAHLLSETNVLLEESCSLYYFKHATLVLLELKKKHDL